ncbi:hypothetical protein ACTNDN_10160 [Niallia sp. HCP3S3_B10]|uniref:hypothetical protein n=1 Tax=Niallia sp. HCP3S3_B10 TaxID=3438944 RepID=UPI003F8B2665
MQVRVRKSQVRVQESQVKVQKPQIKVPNSQLTPSNPQSNSFFTIKLTGKHAFFFKKPYNT